jgi:hypothetical protein
MISCCIHDICSQQLLVSWVRKHMNSQDKARVRSEGIPDTKYQTERKYKEQSAMFLKRAIKTRVNYIKFRCFSADLITPPKLSLSVFFAANTYVDILWLHPDMHMKHHYAKCWQSRRPLLTAKSTLLVRMTFIGNKVRSFKECSTCVDSRRTEIKYHALQNVSKVIV